MKKSTLTLFISIVCFLFIAACSEQSRGGVREEGGEAQNDSDTNLNEDSYPETIVIGTAGQGGVYYIYGGGIAKLLEDHLNVRSNVEVTGGPVHNLQLTSTKEMDIGMITLGPGYEAITGKGDWTGGQKLENIRIIFPMYTTYFQWWAPKSSGIATIEDTDGERVGTGPAGGTAATYIPSIYEVLGFKVEPVQAALSDLINQQMDGQLNVIGTASGIPNAALTEFEVQKETNIFGVDGENRRKVLEALPYFDEATIPAGTYEQQEGDIETISMFNFGITHKEMNAEFIYDMVKTYHEHIDQLKSSHVAAEEAVPEAILKNEIVPLHVGAIRYYEEIGLELPDSVYPPEYEANEG